MEERTRLLRLLSNVCWVVVTPSRRSRGGEWTSTGAELRVTRASRSLSEAEGRAKLSSKEEARGSNPGESTYTTKSLDFGRVFLFRLLESFSQLVSEVLTRL